MDTVKTRTIIHYTIDRLVGMDTKQPTAGSLNLTSEVI